MKRTVQMYALIASASCSLSSLTLAQYQPAPSGTVRVSTEVATCAPPIPPATELARDSFHCDIEPRGEAMAYTTLVGGRLQLRWADLRTGCSGDVLSNIPVFDAYEPVIKGGQGFYEIVFTSPDPLEPLLDTNGVEDVYLIWIAEGPPGVFSFTTRLVSRTPTGTAGNGPSRSPHKSRSGGEIAFSSEATDLVAVDANGAVADVFVFDPVVPGTITLASVDPTGTQFSTASTHPEVGLDGGVLVLAFENANAGGGTDVYLRTGSTTQLIAAGASRPTLSGVRDLVILPSEAVAYVNAAGSIEVFDMAAPAGSQISDTGAIAGLEPKISADGRYVAFVEATSSRVHRFDSHLRVTVPVDIGAGLTTDPSGLGIRPPGIDWRGGEVAFATTSVFQGGGGPADSGTFQDIYFGTLAGFTNFCDGVSGSLSATCPCGIGWAYSGCDTPIPPMQGGGSTGGIALALTGLDQANGRGTFSAQGFPASSAPTALLLRSNAAFPGVAFGDGSSCLGTMIDRQGSRTAQNGIATWNHTHDGGPGFVYQVWFRVLPTTWCDPIESFSFSNAIGVPW